MGADLRLAGLAAAGVLLIGSYLLAYHLGGNASRSAAEAAHAAQLAAVVNVLETQRNAALAESVRRQGILDAFHQTPPNPALAGLAERVFVTATRPGCVALPGAGPLARGAIAAPALAAGPASPSRLSGLTQAVFDAAALDAAQMKAMIALASPAAVR